MADIISIEEKLKLEQNKKQEILRKRQILAVQKVFQCTRCILKCEKCGIQITQAQPGQKKSRPRVPYRFCESCLDEYLDFIETLKGKGDPDCFWHNEVWLETWRLWVDYQDAVERYIKTREFKKLLVELKQDL